MAAHAQTQFQAPTHAQTSADVEFERLYALHSQRVLAYCRRQLGGRTEAEDAAQTVFLHALRCLRRGVVPEVESAWLFTIAHNVCRTYWRSAMRRRGAEDQRDPGVLQETLAQRELDHDELFGLEDALARIPESQRHALLLREWHGLAYREIAATLGITQTAVEMLLFRARRSLAAELRGERRVRLPKSLTVLVDLLSNLKGLLGGSSALKLAAAGVAVATLAAGGSDVSQPNRLTRAADRNAASLVAPTAASRRDAVQSGDSDVRAARRLPAGAGEHATQVSAPRHDVRANRGAHSSSPSSPARPGQPAPTPREPQPPSAEPPTQPSPPHGGSAAPTAPSQSPSLPGLPAPPTVPPLPDPQVPGLPDVPDVPTVPQPPQIPGVSPPSLP